MFPPINHKQKLTSEPNYDATKTPYQNTTKTTINPPSDQRHSGLSPTLDYSTLHGGWKFTKDIYNHPTTQPNVTVISWENPRVVLFHNFISQDEINHLLTAAEALERSEVVSDDGALNQARTSYGAWLNGARRTPTIHKIQHRIYESTLIPEEFCESLYLLRYSNNQQYEAHCDHCSIQGQGKAISESCSAFLKRAGGPKCGIDGGGVTCGDRLATMILYLKSPTKGGETAFPEAAAYTSNATARSLEELMPGENSQPWYCKEDAHVLKVLPGPGDAVFFFDYIPSDGGGLSAKPDPTSLHAGCPPLEGEKFIATRWMRSSEFS